MARRWRFEPHSRTGLTPLTLYLLRRIKVGAFAPCVQTTPPGNVHTQYKHNTSNFICQCSRQDPTPFRLESAYPQDYESRHATPNKHSHYAEIEF